MRAPASWRSLRSAGNRCGCCFPVTTRSPLSTLWNSLPAQEDWVAGCERCRSHLVHVCRWVVFSPGSPTPPTTTWPFSVSCPWAWQWGCCRSLPSSSTRGRTSPWSTPRNWAGGAVRGCCRGHDTACCCGARRRADRRGGSTQLREPGRSETRPPPVSAALLQAAQRPVHSSSK